MEDIVSWEYYSSHFLEMDEKSFEKLKYKATKMVTRQLYKPIESLNDEELTTVKDCICDLANYMQSHENNVSSISNDGYSESYQSVSFSQQNDEKNAIIDTWLGHLRRRYIGF